MRAKSCRWLKEQTDTPGIHKVRRRATEQGTDYDGGMGRRERNLGSLDMKDRGYCCWHDLISHPRDRTTEVGA